MRRSTLVSAPVAPARTYVRVVGDRSSLRDMGNCGHCADRIALRT